MTGRIYSHSREEVTAAGREQPLLQVKGLVSPGHFYDVDLEVRRSEILALSGLVGAGRTEVGEAIFGLRPYERGSIMLDGERHPPGRPDLSIERGLCMLSEEREEGLFLEMSIQANVAAPSLTRFGNGLNVDDREARDVATHYLRELTIRAPSVNVSVDSLSGGNQQKVLLAMWLATDPKVLIVDEPTKGIDVGAKDEIHHILLDLARSGTGILLISSDQAEIHRLANRVLVMRRGRIITELPGGVGEEEVVPPVGHHPRALRDGARHGQHSRREDHRHPEEGKRQGERGQDGVAGPPADAMQEHAGPAQRTAQGAGIPAW
jgi:ABC-type sugar transport system ATPase subunit